MADAGGYMAEKSEMFRFLLRKTRGVLESSAGRDEKLKTVCKLLKYNVPYYNWVGFYIVDKRKRNELVLGPFEGTLTEHTRIPFGRGICGQAAKLRETFLVQDVSKETNYLSCSANVKSEIVIPILHKEAVVGELDIDSHSLSPFSKEDETFLKKIAEMVSRIL